MKRNLLKKYNALIAFFLTIIGVGGACSMSGCEYGTPGMEYGVPSATYKVNGTVTAEDNSTISNIRVVMLSDTSYTDVNGVYHAEIVEFPKDQEFPMEFDDIDGAQNGTFQSKDTTVVFDNPRFVNGDDSWYAGEASKELNIKLKSGS